MNCEPIFAVFWRWVKWWSVCPVYLLESDLYESDFTSIQQRLYDYRQAKNEKSSDDKTLTQRVHAQQALKETLALADCPEAPLMRFDGGSQTDIHCALPFTQEDYFELVDVTGRILREDKRGYRVRSIFAIVAYSYCGCPLRSSISALAAAFLRTQYYLTLCRLILPSEALA